MSTILLKCPVPHHWCSILSSARLQGLSQHHATSSLHLSSLKHPRHRLTTKPAPVFLQPLHAPHLTPPQRALQTARGGNPRLEERLRRRDGMPAEFRLVYVAPSELYVRCAAAAVVAPLLLAAPLVALRPATVLLAADWQVAVGAGLYSLLAAAVLLLAYRYPFRMYHSAARREFRAVLTGPLLFSSRQLSLAEGSVSRVQSTSNVLPWKKDLYTCEQGKLVLMDSGFQSAEMYNRLLGYHSDEGGEDESEA